MFNRKGFTLIELVMVIVILAILAIVAIPKYFDLQNDAKASAEKGVVGGVRSGVYSYYAQYKTFPAALDNATVAACTSTNPCFTNVLGQGGLYPDWTKSSSNTYVGPTNTTYTYTAGTGEFN
ncbi:MAG: type II secretion system GspH family protein [Candidatus Omnitrophica bacterium]|nr:type II secretion system GspH family protein [Candidatus Omnitrophota bacterium]MBU1870052.1 type II secretion system GspH family protein [Candidatus Omnitrophota bacterium]